MLAHARSLKEENEAARRVLVAQLEEKRFRLSSDVLRGRASQVMTERVALDRISQLQEKAEQLKSTAAAEAAEMEQQDGEAKLSAARRQAEAEARRRLEHEMAHVLGQQVAVKQELRARDSAWEASQVSTLLAADRAAAEAVTRAEADRRSSARVEYGRLQEFNRAEKAVKDGAAKHLADAAKADLDATLAREAAENAAEEAAALERRRAALAYQASLTQQTAIQAEDRGWLDEFYKAESEKEWTKRQSKWDKEAAERAALLKEVKDSRQDQIAEHTIRKTLGAREDERQMEEFRKAQAIDDAKAAAKEAKRRAGLEAQYEYARKQMADNAEARERAKQQDYLDWRVQKKFDKEYEVRPVRERAGAWYLVTNTREARAHMPLQGLTHPSPSRRPACKVCSTRASADEVRHTHSRVAAGGALRAAKTRTPQQAGAH
jgi:hypothetical protein